MDNNEEEELIRCSFLSNAATTDDGTDNAICQSIQSSINAAMRRRLFCYSGMSILEKCVCAKKT